MVPLPGADSTVSVPPTPLARSRIETRPRWRPACRIAVGSKPLPSSVTRRTAPGPRRSSVTSTLVGARVAQRVVQGLLGDAQQRLLLGGGQGAYAAAVEGDARGVGAVEDLDLGAQRGDQAVLVERGGAQLDDGGAQFVGGLGGQRGDLLELALGAGRVAVDEGGGGLGGQPQGEELLADGVVQFVGEPGALLGDGELAAALVQPGVGEGDRRVLGEDRQQFLVLLGEAAAALRLGAPLVGEEERADDLVAVPDRQAEEVGHVGVGGGPALEAGVLADVGEALGAAPRGASRRGCRAGAGSGPMAFHCSSLTPSTTNWAKPPWSSGTPRAAYSASSSSRAEATIVLRTSRTSRCLLMASSAALTACEAGPVGRDSWPHRTGGV